jgi:hypothetical protein
MHILSLEIHGFRGIKASRLILSDQVALVGPNGSGKSTIVDALSLAFGRQKLVRDLTEHDFTGSKPEPQDRFRIIATMGGFEHNDPEKHPHWFRQGRAIPKWWDPGTKKVEPEPADGCELCAQIGYAARFDHEDLGVKQLRYFHDDDQVQDPFDEESVPRFPDQLLHEIGYFVLPARRTWAATISFGSELFRKAVATIGGIPAPSVLAHLERLRNPDPALENDNGIKPLVESINERMAQLLPGKPKLQLRITSTDSDSLLRSLVPHYMRDDGFSLPAARHGTGLISLQTLVLLLEIGKARKAQGQSFILALEEPELHVPPGLQRRLIGDACAVSDQAICTTHAPRVAGFFDAESIRMLRRVPKMLNADEGEEFVLEACPLATSMVEAPNALIQLFTDKRLRLVEALMFPRVLVPEGRIDFEWLRLLLDIAETGARSLEPGYGTVPPYGSVVGVVPTRDSAIQVTYERLAGLHDRVFALVDGDDAGNDYVGHLLGCNPPPRVVVQWVDGWAIEDAVTWAIDAGGQVLFEDIQERLNRQFVDLPALREALANDNGAEGGLKSHYMAHEEIANAMKASEPCVVRVEQLLEGLCRAALGMHEDFPLLVVDSDRSVGEQCTVYRFEP